MKYTIQLLFTFYSCGLFYLCFVFFFTRNNGLIQLNNVPIKSENIYITMEMEENNDQETYQMSVNEKKTNNDSNQEMKFEKDLDKSAGRVKIEDVNQKTELALEKYAHGTAISKNIDKEVSTKKVKVTEKKQQKADLWKEKTLITNKQLDSLKTNVNPISNIPLKSSKPNSKMETEQISVKVVNCSKILSGDNKEIEKAEMYQEKHKRVPITDEQYSLMTQNCSTFKSKRGYILGGISQEEASFPIAFSLQVYKDVEQIERTLRAIYRPHNYYCIHVDAKADQKVITTLQKITNCFPNVFIASRLFTVNWAFINQTLAEVSCMQDLIKTPKWKYLINLTGQEFPLKTNKEIVTTLQKLKGRNDIAGYISERYFNRTKFVHVGTRQTSELKPPPPHNITITKGGIFMAATRGYIDFIVNNNIAQDFLEWCSDTRNPDETFFSSLNHNPQLNIPGAYTGKGTLRGTHNRYINWTKLNITACHGMTVRSVCIFGVRDLPELHKQGYYNFVNKFHLDYQPLALDCMEERYFRKVNSEKTWSNTLKKQSNQKTNI